MNEMLMYHLWINLLSLHNMVKIIPTFTVSYLQLDQLFLQ